MNIKEFTPYELSVMSAWASSAFTAWLISNPKAGAEERRAMFLNCLEGGAGLALELRESR